MVPSLPFASARLAQDMACNTTSRSPPEAIGPLRDLRVDFFRGLALLMVLVDHVESNSGSSIVGHWTLLALGFSDAAEVFVFLSGYAFGLSYSRRLERDGFLACQRKSLSRAVQIYLTYAMTLGIVLGIGHVFSILGIGAGFYGTSNISWFAIDPLATRLQPTGFAILALYIIILPFMPMLLVVARWKPGIAWLLSGGIYIATQIPSGMNMIHWLGVQSWPFNPLAWQFLFFIGLSAASLEQSPVKGRLRGLFIPLSSAMLLLGVFVVKIGPWLAHSLNDMPTLPFGLSRFEFPPVGKSDLHPLRLLHCLALFYLVSVMFPSKSSCWKKSFTQPLVICGQHSLQTYAFGLILTAFCAFAFGDFSNGLVVVDASVCLLSIVAAQLFRRVIGNLSSDRGGRRAMLSVRDRHREYSVESQTSTYSPSLPAGFVSTLRK